MIFICVGCELDYLLAWSVDDLAPPLYAMLTYDEKKEK
jgi:hypothetical protein